MDKHDRVWISLMNFGHKLGCHQMADRSFFFSKAINSQYAQDALVLF